MGTFFADPDYDQMFGYGDPASGAGGGGGYLNPWGGGYLNFADWSDPGQTIGGAGGYWPSDPGQTLGPYGGPSGLPGTGRYNDPGTGSGFYDSSGNWVANPGYQSGDPGNPTGPNPYGLDPNAPSWPATGTTPNTGPTIDQPPDINFPPTPYPTFGSPQPLPGRLGGGILSKIGRVASGLSGGGGSSGGGGQRGGLPKIPWSPTVISNTPSPAPLPGISSNLPSSQPNSFQPIGIQTPGAGGPPAGPPPNAGGGALMSQIMAGAMRQRPPQPQPQANPLSYDDAVNAAGI